MPKINDEYDIGKAFEAIENELIASMMRNMRSHKEEEIKEDKQWTMWQAEQLKALEKYKKINQKKYGNRFKSLNLKIEELIRAAKDEGDMNQEIAILEAIKKGFPAKRISKGAAAEFFKLNERKLEALIKATTDDMKKAETAVLRMAADQYRKIIFNAQVYANTGAGTYEKAVDMAAKDFLSAGLNCVEYANGARHTLSDYADMAIRTACKRAYLQGEGVKRQEWGIHTVIVNKRGNPCPKCLPFCGKVLIDDVWSGGSQKDGNYPLMSTAVAYGLYHPRCKDSHTTYFPGISTADDTWIKEELEAIGLNAKREARQQYAERQEKRFERLAEYSLDPENQKRYAARMEEWKKRRAAATDTTTAIGKKQNSTIPMNRFGQEITFDEKMSEERWEKIKEIISQLSLQYDTRLTTVKFGADLAAGTMGSTNGVMRLNGSHPSVAIHEFAHSIAVQHATKIGLANDLDFWKEIRKVRTKYKRDAGNDTKRWISSYEHSDPGLDEFFAEAFTHAKMREMKLEIPNKYGADFTYSQQILDITNRYFGKSVEKTVDSGIMELYRKTDDEREGFKFITDEIFNNLTIAARKKGAVIIRGTKEAEEHLKKQGAAASNIGDVLIFRKDVCISEVLEETYHFEQNILKMNDDKGEPLRSILNEIDAKQYLLKNAGKYKIPRNEVELTKNQLESYQRQLEEYRKDGK